MSKVPHVYLVYDLGRHFAAYTIKRDMVSWLRRQDNPQRFSVLRVRNGRDYLKNDPSWFDVEELLA